MSLVTAKWAGGLPQSSATNQPFAYFTRQPSEDLPKTTGEILNHSRDSAAGVYSDSSLVTCNLGFESIRPESDKLSQLTEVVRGVSAKKKSKSAQWFKNLVDRIRPGQHPVAPLPDFARLRAAVQEPQPSEIPPLTRPRLTPLNEEHIRLFAEQVGIVPGQASSPRLDGLDSLEGVLSKQTLDGFSEAVQARLRFRYSETQELIRSMAAYLPKETDSACSGLTFLSGLSEVLYAQESGSTDPVGVTPEEYINALKKYSLRDSEAGLALLRRLESLLLSLS